MGRRRRNPPRDNSRRAARRPLPAEPLIPIGPREPPRPPVATPPGTTIAPPGTIGPPVVPGPIIIVPPGFPTPERPTHHFRILRPADLVVLDVLGYDLRLAEPDDDPDVPIEKLHRLVADGDDPRLEVRFTFQHLLEEAEPEQAIPPPPTPVPIPALAANGSRLVYDVGADEAIVYSIEGVLDAMRRLPLRVAPLALPRSIPSRFTSRAFDDIVTAVVLPGGTRLTRTNIGLVLAPPARGSAPAVNSPRDLISQAKALRTARNLLARERGIDLSRSSVGGALGPGSFVFRPPRFRPRRQTPRAPRLDETAIEAPFRVILSPSDQGGFAHRLDPGRVAPNPDRLHDPERIELWHSRLGVRRVDDEGNATVDEVRDPQRIVRAIWARDMDTPPPPTVPFLASLEGVHREAIVRQSADPTITPPEPVEADKLYLSSIGAWLDLHGQWDDQPYLDAGIADPIIAWDHEAAAGRDNYVRVVEPYYLFPFGHLANLVTITERKIIDIADPQARLYQRQFITLREPVRTYDDRRMPFTQVRIRPLVTPNLDIEPLLIPPPFTNNDVFWPTIGGKKFEFVLDCLDHDGRRVVVSAALLAVKRGVASANFAAVESAYGAAPDRAIDGDGQSIAMATSGVPGDTAYETQQLKFLGTAVPGRSTPHLENADIVVPSMQHLAPAAASIPVEFATPYLDDGFGGPNTEAQVLLSLITPTKVEFGGGTDRSGGFIQPDLPVEGLSRAIGLVGDIASVTDPTPGAQLFDPHAFLDGVIPKLFGLFELTDILALAGLDAAPAFITDQLDKVAALLADAEDLVASVERAVDRLDVDAIELPTLPLRDQATAALNALQTIQTTVVDTVSDLTDAIEDLLALDTPSDLPAVITAVSDLLDDLAGVVTDVQQTVQTLPMPPSAKAELERLVGALSPLLDAAAIANTIESIADFVNGIDPANMSIRAKFDWRPVLTNFPAGPDADALFIVPSDGFLLSIEARVSGSDGVGLDVLAELRDFALNLFPGAPLIKISFDRIAFRAASGRKAEVDVVFGGIEWQGILGFIQTLQELIPFDGFSDPPYVDVSTDGVTAGFDLALPNVGVGVFSLENISLGADVRIPFLGDAVTVGFNFCTREKPFRMTVMAIGGGGFVGIRLSPKGLVMLEMSLEAGASLSVNLGVASGSVSVMVGVYMRLEGEEGSLTGYFRIRGEVDVLGIISASITLELSLTYEFSSGKMVGRASITVEIEVLFFSASVEISVERRLAGGAGDPTLAQILGIAEDGTPLTDVPAAWADYCGAFAGA